MKLEIEKSKLLQEEEEPQPPPQPPRAHFVLIHGIGGGGWSWYKIRSLMENSGYKVTCLDLKGAGIEQAGPNTIVSFDEYNKPLIDFLSSLPHSEQVILVGHSAGLSVTDATHKFAKKIKVAVYIAAIMLRTGFVTTQDVKDDSTLAAMLLRPGPIQALQSARFKEGGEGAERVPRIYLKTTYDRVMKPEQQDAMIRKWQRQYICLGK